MPWNVDAEDVTLTYLCRNDSQNVNLREELFINDVGKLAYESPYIYG